jgi:hypothetical protein
VHYDWHWFWAYGNGDVGNQGIHQMDVARWFLGEPGWPNRTLSLGGRMGYVDDGETPNTQIVVHDYAIAPIIFEVRGLPTKAGVAAAGGDPAANQGGASARDMDKYQGVDIGNVIDCQGGSVIVPSYTTARVVDRNGKLMKTFSGPDRHMDNFIQVVRSRRQADLFGPIDEGAVSSALCHLGNISHRMGRTASEDELHDAVKSSALLTEAEERMIDHLHANKIDPDKSRLTRGVPLLIDAKNERFTGLGAERATALMKDEYREKFAVPEIIV